MKINKPICLLSIFLLCFAVLHLLETKAPENTKYLNTDVLKDIKLTESLLKKDGLTEHTLNTADGITLKCLYKKHPYAQYTIVFYLGMLGIKEEAAPFVDLLADQPCNIVLIDGRNKELTFNKLRMFGLNEHFDILAALDFIKHDNPNLPIFIHGSCAGAFFGIHALYHLHQRNQLSESNVRGIILDSSWGSRVNISYHAPAGWALESICKMLYGTKNVYKKQQEHLLFYVLSSLIGKSYFLMHVMSIKLLFSFQEASTNLYKIIHTLPTPMFFIHAKHDHFAPYVAAKKLADSAQQATTWWIESGGHSIHHLKYQALYTQQLTTFINNQLNRS